MHKITPFLWYNANIKEAVDLYTSVFPAMKVIGTSPGPAGSLMSATLELEGQQVILFNGGPSYQLSPAASLYVNCETQEEVDYFWDTLCEGGEPSRCGWLQDKYGLSWQVGPTILNEMLLDKDPQKRKRVMEAMLKMDKIDIKKLKQAYDQK